MHCAAAPQSSGADTYYLSLRAGSYAVNPATQAHIPIWVADYVLGSYGSGAIMAVPAHDTRDWAFAQAFNLPTPQVMRAAADQAQELPLVGEAAYLSTMPR